MSDFFGGILDGLRGFTSDVTGFFDSALDMVGLTGSDVMKAAGAALKDDGGSSGGGGGTSSMPDTGVMSALNSAKFQAGKSEALKSVDPKEVEAEWIRRMQAFTQDNN